MGIEDVGRDQALLWLNDRVGQSLSADVRVDCGDYSVSVLSVVGELSHWTADSDMPLVGHVEATVREQLVGLYQVGGGHFDLSDERLPGEFAIRGDPDELVVSFGDTELLFTHPTKRIPKRGDA
jgi:hypothetical protein